MLRYFDASLVSRHRRYRILRHGRQDMKDNLAHLKIKNPTHLNLNSLFFLLHIEHASFQAYF